MLKENEELNRFLEAPETYGVDAVKRIDTHASHVFLAGERAYKLKRPVKYPFMDFSTLEKREAAARQELELNRRTAPELYLHIAAVEQIGSTFRIVEDGAPGPNVIDWIVVMRRFEQSALLSSIADAGELEDAHVDALRDAIVALHAGTSSEDVDWVASVKWVVEDNIDELRTYAEIFDDRSTIQRAS
ncbi:MAG: hypothetical protein AAF658_21605, partial [Myxococcota bacterium]